jgi:hypothetical protein
MNLPLRANGAKTPSIEIYYKELDAKQPYLLSKVK